MSPQRSAQQGARPLPAPRDPGPPAWVTGPQWAQLRFRQPGWMLLPLRGFLGVTFVYAGLQKLANPAYLDPNNPASVVGQMRALRNVSPIGPLLGLSLHAPTLVGLLIASGELAVGFAVLLGFWTRLAGLGGMLLALTFFLTVSWSTTPYFYGSDIVFLFAWSVIAAFGAAGVLSLDGWMQARARRLAGLPARPPVFASAERLAPNLQSEVDRRTLLLGVRTAGVVAVAAAATGGATAAVGRLVGGTNRARGGLTLRQPAGSTPAPTPTRTSPGRHPSKSPPPGTAIGPASAVPVGQAARFTDPGSGGPAWVVQPDAGRFVAFSATCTHAGCTVDFDRGSATFVCPCHGGTFNARNGRVLGGPPPAPLPAIPVHVVDGQIRVD
ncbi:MAG: thiosulfate dehydrogenase (quinone) large subunit [Frankiaceae bacterium]|nr:thiosulfate dehydrogenase (quinone) large subunit [Frankiaceae bacterium]